MYHAANLLHSVKICIERFRRPMLCAVIAHEMRTCPITCAILLFFYSYGILEPFFLTTWDHVIISVIATWRCHLHDYRRRIHQIRVSDGVHGHRPFLGCDQIPQNLRSHRSIATRVGHNQMGNRLLLKMQAGPDWIFRPGLTDFVYFGGLFAFTSKT